MKQAFVRQLVGFCAEVDRQLVKIDVKGQPGEAADQLARFVSQARSQPAPEVDRGQFETLLTEMDATVQHFRAAQAALSVGDHAAYQKAFEQANQRLVSADAAAQKYGMPPLDSCPQHESPGSAPAPTPAGGPAPAAAWQLRHAALEAVQQVNATVLDGRIWVAGGLTMADEATASTQFYDPTIDAWEAGPSLPEPVHHAALVTYRGQLVLIGGFRGRAGDPLAVTSAQVLFFDEKAGRWVQGPSLQHERGAAAAAVVGDQIVVAGGRTGHPEQLVGQTEVFDGTGWRDAADIPLPGDHLAAATDGTYLYAVGGRKFTAGSNTDAVQRYDPAANQWVAMPPMPTPVSGAGAAIVDGQLLVAGGESTTSVSSAVLAYDLTAPTASWVALAPLNLGRHGLGVTAVGNTLYAIAGSTRAGHTASNTAVGALNVPPRRPHPAETDRAVLKSRLDQLLAASPITFSPNDTAPTPAGAETVEKIAVLLAPATGAGIGVKLTGHTARTPGHSSRAKQLSEQRALAVAEALVSRGVTADRIQTEGASDSVPKGDASTSRRVEIQLI